MAGLIFLSWMAGGRKHIRRKWAGHWETAGNIVNWKHNVKDKWDSLRFGEVKVETRDGQHFFEVRIYLHDLNPGMVRMELYADGVMDSAPLRQEMKLLNRPADVSGVHVYSAAVSAARLPTDYTARVIPYCDGVAVPLEETRILWQR